MRTQMTKYLWKIKIWVLCLVAILMWGVWFMEQSVAYSQDIQNSFHYGLPDRSSVFGDGLDTEIGKIIKTDAVEKEEWLLIRLMQTLGIDTHNEYSGPLKAFYYIKKLINYALSFVSFIAFGLLLYSFYMMLIGDGNKGRDKVKATLKGIAIAIIVMSVAWLIVSAIFWLYGAQVGGVSS